ncbi:MAG: hypothetical protein RI996_553 [Candidatus Parcubacteria bacterium]|jgi:hypothetical protein
MENISSRKTMGELVASFAIYMMARVIVTFLVVPIAFLSYFTFAQPIVCLLILGLLYFDIVDRFGTNTGLKRFIQIAIPLTFAIAFAYLSIYQPYKWGIALVLILWLSSSRRALAASEYIACK